MRDTEASKITVSLKNASFHVPYKTLSQRVLPSVFNPQQPPSNVTGSPLIPSDGYELLHDITMIAQPHHLTALLGPSGCGKTTLLNVLGLRARGRLTGTVRYNNIAATHKALKGCVSMCYANDRLLPYLTVQETLYFASILRMGQCTKQERLQRVNDVVEELALDHIRHTRIGGIWGKGISSGELRRTAIGVELIGNPSVLLLDEPSSGLDAVLAFEMMLVLKSLAVRGRTIICAVHQPRAAIYDLFDSLVLMSKGRVLYHGNPNEARKWLTEKAGIFVSDKMNLADALIDVASAASVDDALKQTKGHKSAQDIAEAFSTSEEIKIIQSEIEAITRTESLNIQVAQRNPLYQWFVEVGAICFRGFKNSLRNPLSCAIVLAIQGLMGCFLGALFYKLPEKYLPTVVPPDIGSEQSSIMFLFNSIFVNFINNGIDGEGYNPLLEMLISGVDGNSSEPFLYIGQTSMPQTLYNSMDCVHERFELNKCFPSTDLSQYYDVWETSSAGDEEWAGGSDFSAPILTSYLLKSFQVFDYSLAKYDWENIMRLFRAMKDGSSGSYILLPTVCTSNVRELASTWAGCSGVPGMPTPAGMLQMFCGIVKGMNVDEASVKPAFSCDKMISDDSTYHQAVDIVAQADRAAQRRLQAAAFISSNGKDVLETLPPVLKDIIERLPEYGEAFTECPHEFCEMLKAQMNDSSDNQLTNGYSALKDYAAALGAIMNIVGALFFSIANIGFASYDALISFPQERSMINREMMNYAYRPSSYFIGKTLADMLFQLSPAILLVTTFYFLIGVDAGEHGLYFWKYLGICALTVFAAYGFAYLTSALSPSMEVAVVSAPVILVIFLCCSGFFVRDGGVPGWLSWVRYLSFYRWGFYALIMNQFPPDGSYGGVPNSFSLALAGINERRMGVCCGALVALGVGFRIFAYLGLRFMHRKIGIEQ